MLEAQELQDGEVDRFVQSETTLVWTEGRVELHTVTYVDFDFTVVIFPWNAELDDTLRDLNDTQSSFVFWLLFEKWSKGCFDFVESLFEFWFCWWCLWSVSNGMDAFPWLSVFMQVTNQIFLECFACSDSFDCFDCD